MGNKDDRRAAFSELCLDSWFELEIRNEELGMVVAASPQYK